MANSFADRHKKKSLLALLLLFLKGRGKYAAMFLAVFVTSAPLLISRETVARFLALPAISSGFHMLGLGGVVESYNPHYSGDLVNSEILKGSAFTRNNYWNGVSVMLGPVKPCSGKDCENSSLEMLRRGGANFWAKADKKNSRPNQVAGAAGPTPGKSGLGEAAPVDMKGLVDGDYGNVMAGALKDGFSGGWRGGAGSSSYAGGMPPPYINKDAISKPGGTGGGAKAMYSAVIKKAGAKVPAPGNPQKVVSGQLGKTSAFNWKAAQKKILGGQKSAISAGSKTPMYQLAETFSVTEYVKSNGTDSKEFQASSVGATYDGNSVGASALQSGSDPTYVADGSYGGDIEARAKALAKVSEECTNAQSESGTKMSNDGADMDKIAANMGKTPKCYDHDQVDMWNYKVMQLRFLCLDFNSNSQTLAAKCNSDGRTMSCDPYFKDTKNGGMVISKCSKPNKLIMILIMLLVLLIVVAVFILLGPWIAALVAMLAAKAMSSMGGKITKSVDVPDSVTKNKLGEGK